MMAIVVHLKVSGRRLLKKLRSVIILDKELLPTGMQGFGLRPCWRRYRSILNDVFTHLHEAKLNAETSISLSLQWQVQWGTSNAAFVVQFLSFSCSFRQKSYQIIGFPPKPRSWCLSPPASTTVLPLNTKQYRQVKTNVSSICTIG